MKKILLVCALALVLLLGAYKAFDVKKEPLDPSHPITITVWHYYNGKIKNKFDELVSKFNETVGVERGIVVESKSYGDVQSLADAAYDASNKTIGSEAMPDIFAAYPDNAYRISQVTELVDLEQYFSQEELKEFRKEFLDEGRFGNDSKLKIMPIAKSTEILYLNKTYWDHFVAETGVSLDDLSTWEGIIKTAEKYKNYSGKAFMGIDDNANYMLLACIQLGADMYTYSENRAELNFNEDTAYKIWQNYYIPYLKGYFIKNGRFSSDDAKSGKVLAYTGSTAGAGYFPKQVAFSEEESYQIEAVTLPYPCFENGKLYAVQQGAGMCISKSDKAHEYASSLFLKWFTDVEQNVEFAVSTSYFPVKNEALEEKNILPLIDKAEVSNEAIKKSIHTTLNMFDTYQLYGNKPFEGSYDMRVLLENDLFDLVQRDLEKLETRVAQGEEHSKVIEALSSKENFDKWYKEFSKEAEKIISK